MLLQEDGSSAAQQQAEAVARSALAVTVSELDFPVDQYLVIGSPLGLFLALRKVEPARGVGLGTRAAAALMPGGVRSGDGLPAVNRMYNLNHPYDPVAYRFVFRTRIELPSSGGQCFQFSRCPA